MSEWDMVKLGEVATYVNGYPFKPSEWSETGLPIIRIQNLTGTAYETNYFDGVYNEKYVIKSGDILISWSATLGIYQWTNEDALVNQHIFKVVFDKIIIDKTYFIYAVKLLLSIVGNKTHGSTMKHLTKGIFDSLEIPLPPLEKQQEIAEELDNITELITLRKQQLEKLDLLVKAKFVEMFGDPVENPMGYVETKLSDIMLFLTSGSRGWSAYFSTEGEMFLTIKNVKNHHINTNNVQYINAPLGKEAERTKVQVNDLLISITADLGRTGVVSERIANHGAYINQHISLIRLDLLQVNPWFVSYFLETPYGKSQFESKNQSAVKSGLNFEAIKSLQLLLPPLPLQEEFAHYIQAVEETRKDMEQGFEKLELLYRERMQRWFGA